MSDGTIYNLFKYVQFLILQGLYTRHGNIPHCSRTVIDMHSRHGLWYAGSFHNYAMFSINSTTPWRLRNSDPLGAGASSPRVSSPNLREHFHVYVGTPLYKHGMVNLCDEICSNLQSGWLDNRFCKFHTSSKNLLNFVREVVSFKLNAAFVVVTLYNLSVIFKSHTIQ